MLENKNIGNEDKVSLENLSKLVGLPATIISNELFSGEPPKNDINIEDLRAKMIKYLNETMLNEEIS